MEAMDKVKNGGIVAFVTSAGTLDKRDESVRQLLADKADLIGAVRLPGGKNGAFHDNAGTDVTTDIIFLQKHEGKSITEMSDIPDWVHIGETAGGLPINKYFEQNPDMVLGTVVEGNQLYGSGTMVVAEDGFDLKSALHEAVGKLTELMCRYPLICVISASLCKTIKFSSRKMLLLLSRDLTRKTLSFQDTKRLSSLEILPVSLFRRRSLTSRTA